MERKLRREPAGAIYQVMNRGDWREELPKANRNQDRFSGNAWEGVRRNHPANTEGLMFEGDWILWAALRA